MKEPIQGSGVGKTWSVENKTRVVAEASERTMKPGQGIRIHSVGLGEALTSKTEEFQAMGLYVERELPTSAEQIGGRN